MLRSLSLTHTGPAQRLVMKPLAPRFNLITGDNGLGKSFLLDVAWWVLTRTWHDTPALPASPEAVIDFAFDGDTTLSVGPAPWDRTAQEWKRRPGRPPNPGLVLYARVDGSFSVWDPARNYRLYQRSDGGETRSPDAYRFRTRDVLWGLRRTVGEGGTEREQVLCQGLVDDWTRWQEIRDARFELLVQLLSHLGPDGEPLRPGTPQRPTLDDVRLVPTVTMSYGEVPITIAPAGVQRMSKLAYLLTWALSEHTAECERTGQAQAKQVVVLFDEPETHLHPRWQRTVLPSLLAAIAAWRQPAPEVQLLVATHAPLVLASLEPHFDPDRDALWKLDLVDRDVHIERDVWRPRGDANRWLRSDVFDLREATSAEAERALVAARALMGSRSPAPAEVRDVDTTLRRLLPDLDPFLVRWGAFAEDVLGARA